jgi:hypothetical protein
VLDGRYGFENFIVGGGNRLAYAAAKSVAEDPGGSYSPLFIHSSGGLGKTHLLGAIGRRLLEQSPGIRVGYAPTGSLLGELAAPPAEGVGDGHGSGGGEELETRLRELDVLLVDDLQLLAGRPGTLKRLLGALLESGKQIVLASDLGPDAIAGEDQRMLAWLRAGLVVDVQVPDHETRAAILRAKARELGEELSPEIVEELGAHPVASVRELEVLLERVRALRLAPGGPPGGESAEGWGLREEATEAPESPGENVPPAPPTEAPGAPEEDMPLAPPTEIPEVPEHAAQPTSRRAASRPRLASGNVDTFFMDPYKVFLHWKPLADRLLERLERS